MTSMRNNSSTLIAFYGEFPHRASDFSRRSVAFKFVFAASCRIEIKPDGRPAKMSIFYQNSHSHAIWIISVPQVSIA